MPTPEELAALDAAIVRDATEGVVRATNDQGSVELGSFADRLKVKGDADSTTAVRKPHRGIRFSKLNSPGTV